MEWGGVLVLWGRGGWGGGFGFGGGGLGGWGGGSRGGWGGGGGGGGVWGLGGECANLISSLSPTFRALLL